jgi:hypothetical protein
VCISQDPQFDHRRGNNLVSDQQRQQNSSILSGIHSNKAITDTSLSLNPSAEAIDNIIVQIGL